MSKYYYRLRPPGVGCQPEGFGQYKAFDYRTEIEGIGKAYGWVEYPDPLSIDKAWRYDLFPENPEEQGRYAFCQATYGDVAEADSMIKGYLQMGEEIMMERVEVGPYKELLKAALLILRVRRDRDRATARLSEEEKLRVPCPTCGAPVGDLCVSRRFKSRWVGMPTTKNAHPDRRTAFIDRKYSSYPWAVKSPPKGRSYFHEQHINESDLPPNPIHYEGFDSPRTVPEVGGVTVMGVVFYPSMLHPTDAWVYDLIPADPAERGFQFFLEQYEGDYERTIQGINTYLAEGEAVLRQTAKTDRFSRAALPILQAPESDRVLLMTLADDTIDPYFL